MHGNVLLILLLPVYALHWCQKWDCRNVSLQWSMTVFRWRLRRPTQITRITPSLHVWLWNECISTTSMQEIIQTNVHPAYYKPYNFRFQCRTVDLKYRQNEYPLWKQTKPYYSITHFNRHAVERFFDWLINTFCSRKILC